MGILDQIYWLAIVAIGVASVSWTITQEEVFREPREWAEERSKHSKSLFERKLFYVFTCEYCLSHWVTIFFLALTGFKLLFDDWRGYFIAFFVTPWIANQFMSLYRRLRVGIKHENTLAEIQKEKLNGE
jgi:hypothetical protein